MNRINNISNHVAFDCGNSSFRVILGKYDGEKIDMEVIYQVANQAIEINGLYYWDILYIFKELKKGLKMATQKCNKIDSVGICTWGVDFGLLDKNGNIIMNPMSYRNTLGQDILHNLTDEEKNFMFDKSGIQNNKINSIYQLLGIRDLNSQLFENVSDFLMIPDLLNYMFTGQKKTEMTIASTTQVVDVCKKDYSEEIIDYFKLNRDMFCEIEENGKLLGYLKDSIAEELDINKVPFICVPSHDTASAVTAVPSDEEDFLFISSGTWSLIGTELEKPLVNDKVSKYDFANEAGVFGTTTFLKNSTGMHILQSIKRNMESEGEKYTWDEIVKFAKDYNGYIPLFNPNENEFFNPQNMYETIVNAIDIDGQNKYNSPEAVIASAYESLAYSYAYTINRIEEITEKKYDVIHIIGGGSRNDYLNQLTADITGKKVLAGPSEATSIGNILVQLKYSNCNLDLSKSRQIVKNSFDIKEFIPKTNIDKNDIVNKMDKFESIL